MVYWVLLISNYSFWHLLLALMAYTWYKGTYALTGPLPACTCGTQHWDATHTHTPSYIQQNSIYSAHQGCNYWGKTMLIFVDE